MNKESEILHTHERSTIKHKPYNGSVSVLSSPDRPIWPCVATEKGIGECEQQFPNENWPLDDVILWEVDTNTLLGDSPTRTYKLIFVEFPVQRDGYCGFICFDEVLK